MKKSTLTFILFLLLINFGFSTGPVWSIKFDAAINWQKVTPVGQLLASTSKGLIGIDTQSGKQLWVIEDLKNCPEESYEVISGSPFISVFTAEGKKNMMIVEPLNGKVVFSSKEAGLESVTDRYFLFESNKILVIGSSASGKFTEMVMVDMLTGTKVWNKQGAYSFTTGVKDLGNDEVLLTSAFFASRINAGTGDEIWKSALDPRTKGMTGLLTILEGPLSKKLTKEEIMAQLITTDFAPDIFIIAAQKKNESTKTDSKGVKTVSVTYTSVYMAFDIKTGTHKWEQVVEERFPLGISYPTNEGLVVCSSSDGNFNMLNYNDGTGMLGKKGNGLKLKGAASGVAPLNDGKLLMVSASGSNSGIDLLDPAAGILVFEKSVRMKGVVSYTELFSNGVLLGSDKEVNFLNISTGEWYLDNAIDGNYKLIGGSRGLSYIFNTKDNLVYFKDANATSYKPLGITELEFQGKEVPQNLEITDDGILITSDQNMALIDMKGDIVYNKYFPAPKQSGFKKALLIANAVRAAYYTAAYATYSAGFGAASQSIEVKDASSKATKDVTAEISKAFGGAATTGANVTADYIKMATHRFKATTQGTQYNLIMTAEAKNETKIIQVNRANGEVTNAILIGKDKEPVYDVDLIEGKLYYMKSADQMEGYAL